MSPEVPQIKENQTLNLIKAYQSNSSTEIQTKLVELHEQLVHEAVGGIARRADNVYGRLFDVGLAGLLRSFQTYQPIENSEFVDFAAACVDDSLRGYLMELLQRSSEHDCAIAAANKADRQSQKTTSTSIPAPRNPSSKNSQSATGSKSSKSNQAAASNQSNQIDARKATQAHKSFQLSAQDRERLVKLLNHPDNFKLSGSDRRRFQQLVMIWDFVDATFAQSESNLAAPEQDDDNAEISASDYVKYVDAIAEQREDHSGPLKSTSMQLLQEYRRSPSAELRNRLVQINIGLVRKEAFHWTNQCTETFDDLVQVGSIGLIRAVERFDIARGRAFSSFAVPYIRGEIQHYLRDKSPTLRMPRRWLVLYNQASKVVRELRAQLGREPTDREVAKVIEIEEAEWQEIKLACQNRSPLSLDAPMSDDDDTTLSLGDLLTDHKYRSFQLSQEDSLRLYQALSHLEDRTRQVVEFVFLKELTHREVADILGISAVTVSRQVKKGLVTLKKVMTTPIE
ncbi:RNA polymerase, sigma 28 subunit, FliA/WhiG subfamily [Thalassoporum mexicanum PCC 7367]|nr:RNA polymerase, sigma 28 subunit, FliA/WhiG subfamily [Pseudanabaena sp. PCC 7367]